MATVYADAIAHGELSVVDRQGTIESARRTFLVTGLVSTNYEIIGEALNTSGVPQYGDSFPGNDNIIVVNRNARVLDEDNNRKVVVEVEYTTLGLEDGNYRFQCSTSISEDSTSGDVNGNLVSLSYTYPVDYENPQYAGLTSTQAAELTVYRPESTLSTTGITATSNPNGIVDSWAGYLNSDQWQGGAAGTWMCTRCDWVPHDLDASPPKYKFTFEFQKKRASWTQTAYFRTDDTGKIPSDLVSGVGYKRVVTNPYRPFGDLFPDA